MKPLFLLIMTLVLTGNTLTMAVTSDPQTNIFYNGAVLEGIDLHVDNELNDFYNEGTLISFELYVSISRVFLDYDDGILEDRLEDVMALRDRYNDLATPKEYDTARKMIEELFSLYDESYGLMQKYKEEDDSNLIQQAMANSELAAQLYSSFIEIADLSGAVIYPETQRLLLRIAQNTN